MFKYDQLLIYKYINNLRINVNIAAKLLLIRVVQNNELNPSKLYFNLEYDNNEMAKADKLNSI